MLGTFVANENSGIVRVVMVELWAGLNIAWHRFSAYQFTDEQVPHRHNLRLGVWGVTKGGVGRDRPVFFVVDKGTRAESSTRGGEGTTQALGSRVSRTLARKMIVKLSRSPQRALKREGGYQNHNELGRVETYRD